MVENETIPPYLLCETKKEKVIKEFEEALLCNLIEVKASEKEWLSDYLRLCNLDCDDFVGYFKCDENIPYAICNVKDNNIFVNEELAEKYLVLNYID